MGADVPAAGGEAGLPALLAEMDALRDDVYTVVTPFDPTLPVFTRSNAAEIFPGVCTPATWASAGLGMERAQRAVHRRLGLLDRPGDARMRYIGLFYGRVVLGRDAHMRINRRSFGAPWWPWGGRGVHRQGVDPAAYAPPPRLRDWVADTARRLRALAPSMRAVRLLPGEVDDLERQLDRIVAEAQSLPLESMGRAELLGVLAGQSVGAAVLEAHLTATFLAGASYALLERRLRAWTGENARAAAVRLLAGIGGVESTRPAEAIRELAGLVRAAPRLTGLLAGGDLAGFAEALGSPRDDRERGVADARDEFLRRFGHRSAAEAELSSRTWAEDPAQVDRLVAANLASVGERPGTGGDRDALERRILAAVAPWRRARLRGAIVQARRFMALRERTKSLTVRNGAKSKRLMRELSARLVAEGALGDDRDLTMLTREEVLRLGGAGVGDAGECRDMVGRRRRLAELFARVELPAETFTAPPRPVLAESAAQCRTDAPPDRLVGMGVSAGRHEGLVRVVRTPRAAGVEQGEVLVAPYTDAAWAALFMVAGAVVVDTGGMISHGAIVAREVGIPAVVNVPGTTALRDGDRVSVDGDAGVVVVLARAR